MDTGVTILAFTENLSVRILILMQFLPPGNTTHIFVEKKYVKPFAHTSGHISKLEWYFSVFSLVIQFTWLYKDCRNINKMSSW